MKQVARGKYENMVTVKVTMPVSVTCNDNVKEPNDITVRRNVPRYRSRLLLFALCSLLFAFFGCATTTEVREFLPPEDTLVITGIELQDNSIGVRVSKPFTYTVYRSSDPYKVVIELLNVNLGAFNRKIVSDRAGITEIVPYQIESPSRIARLELLLQSPATVEPEYKDRLLTLKIKGEPPKEAAKEKPAAVTGVKDEEAAEEIDEEEEEELAEVKEPEAPLPKATEITGISFERVVGALKILIRGNGSMTPNVFPLEDRLVIDIPDVILNAPLPSAVISPLKGIRSGIYKEKIRLVLDLKEKIDFNVTSVGNTIVVALQHTVPVAEEKVEVKEIKEPEAVVEGKYTGRKISLDFQDADIVPIFRLLADISGYNVVISPEVKGRLTMKLVNVPWDQALDIILKTFALGKSVEGNIIRIAPLAVLTKESEDIARAKEAEIKAEPLETRIFPISYADVANVEKSIKDSKIISVRGSVSSDKRTSSVLVKDIPAVFPQVENLIKTLDQQTPQVLIEARIVEVSTSDVTDLGIQWGFFERGTNPTTVLEGLSGLGTGTVTLTPFLVDFRATAAGPGAGSGFNFGIMNRAATRGLQLQISALERVGKSRIISNPRVVTTDNEKAKIMQGESIPYPQATAEGTISAAFKDVVLSIEVTPHVTPEKSIFMSVKATKEDFVEFVDIGYAQAPRTSKIEGDTKVLIQDGETLVIGGVYKKTERETSSGVPGLMKIPILGWLFKKRSTTEETSELLIFITPRMVERTI